MAALHNTHCMYILLLLCSCSRRSFMLLTVSSEFLTLVCSIGNSCSMSLSLPLVSHAGRFFNFGIPVVGLAMGCCLLSTDSFSSVAFLTLLAANGCRRATIDVAWAMGLCCLSTADT